VGVRETVSFMFGESHELESKPSQVAVKFAVRNVHVRCTTWQHVALG